MTGEVIKGEQQAPRLPFEVPNYMEGLQSLIIEGALELTNGVTFEADPERFTNAAQLSAREYDHRIRSLWVMARFATNPKSLPYRLYHDSPYLDLPPPVPSFEVAA